MPFSIRRIVTTHDGSGKAVVGSDIQVEATPGVMTKEVGNALIWATDAMPVDLDGGEPPTQQLEPSPNGTIFRILELPPGIPPRMHKTETIDYVIILDGEVDMLLDDSEVHMTAGDVMVQKGTWHGWTNRSDRSCRIAFVLVDARPTK